MTALATMVRGARSAFQAGVTVNGKTLNGRLFPLETTPGRSIALVGGESATYEQLYESQVWVHTVVNKLARNIARLPLKVFINPDEPGERERVREGPLAALLKSPGPRMGPNRLKQEIVSNVAIHGNCVLVPRRAKPGAPVRELLTSSFAFWEVVRDEANATWYVYKPLRGKVIPFRPEEVLHFGWWAGGDGLQAVSPLKALRESLMMEDAAQRTAIAAFENGMRQAGFFSAKESIPQAQFERMRAQLSEQYGGPDNAMRVVLLDNDIDWKRMSNDAQQAELVKLRQMTREEVAAVYDIPPPVIGILDRATFSNITEQHLMLYQDTIQPWTSMIEEVLAVQLIAAEPTMEGEYAEFDFGAVLAGDPVKQTDTLVKAVGGPFMTANEARALKNLPPIDAAEANELRPAPNASLKGETSDGGDEEGR